MISVIVPIYNAEQTIERCVQSILNQTYKNIEILLVNDGSKDSSLSLCMQMAKMDSRIQVINDTNHGVSHARNLGISHAKGNYIMFADSDDHVESQWCATMYEAIEKDSNTLPVCNLYCWKDEQPVVENTLEYDRKEYAARHFWNVYGLCLLNQPYNKIFRKDLLDKYGVRYDETLPLGEDLLFNLEYLKHVSSLTVLNKALYNYIYGQEGSSCNKYYDKYYDMQKKIYKEIRECFEYFEVFDEYEQEYYQAYLGMIYNALENTYITSAELSFRERIRKNRDIMKSDAYRICIQKNKVPPNKLWVIFFLGDPILYEIYHRYIFIKSKENR